MMTDAWPRNIRGDRSDVRLGLNLSALVEGSERLPAIEKKSLRPGDRVLVRTRNSLYHIRILSGGLCSVSGGWFDRKGRSPMDIRINGCTWGGSAIKPDIVAAAGLRLEFSNRLVTSPIVSVFVLPAGSEN
jgi:hypothetical protein